MKSEQIPQGPKESIRRSREIKLGVKEKDIPLRGSPGRKFEEIKEEVDKEVENLKEKHEDWLKKQEEKVLSLFPELDSSKLKQTLEDGLRIFFAQQYRLLRKNKEVELLDDKEYLRSQIFAYTFDFIQSLKQSKKQGIAVGQALEIAKRSYRHNPDVLRSLKAKYPEVDPYIITRAAVGYADSDKFIENVITTIKQPTQKYPEISPYIITHAAVNHPKNPDEFIKKYIETGKEPEIEEDYYIEEDYFAEEGGVF